MSRSSRADSARKRRKKNFTSAQRHTPVTAYPYSTDTICEGLRRLPQELKDIM